MPTMRAPLHTRETDGLDEVRSPGQCRPEALCHML